MEKEKTMNLYISLKWLEEHIKVVSYTNMWRETETDEFVSSKNIHSAPSIDIVRCVECEWSKPNKYGDLDCTCHVPTFRTIPQGYCWRGQRSSK